MLDHVSLTTTSYVRFILFFNLFMNKKNDFLQCNINGLSVQSQKYYALSTDDILTEKPVHSSLHGCDVIQFWLGRSLQLRANVSWRMASDQPEGWTLERDQTETTRQSTLSSAGKNSLTLTELPDKMRFSWWAWEKKRPNSSIALNFIHLPAIAFNGLKNVFITD